MAFLGEAYRILYISVGRKKDLTNVTASVLKPDLSQAGMFPMEELTGTFRGCYYYDYLSSTSDPEGQYFSRVVSPSEGIEDIVRFQLLPGAGDGGNAVVIPPTNIVATIIDQELNAVMKESDDVWAYLRLDKLNAKLIDDETVSAQASGDRLNINLNSDSIVIATE